MNGFLETITWALPFGIGFYIGFEGMKALTEALAAGLKYFLDLLVDEDEEEN